jgi:hypothetical protein
MRYVMMSLVLAGVCALTQVVYVSSASTLEQSGQPDKIAAPAVNPVVQWNRILLAIVRTPTAQPATIHPTRSFAMMHAAIYDAVNAIDKSHRPYAVRLSHVSPSASQNAAAAAAAHDVLVALYPQFQADLDAQLQASLAMASGPDEDEGARVGQIAAAAILALRQNDGSATPPLPYEFGQNPGDYQSTPPNFPAMPQFRNWSQVVPFALPRANLFRPGAPPALNSVQYSSSLNEVQAFGVAGGTWSSPDQTLTGQFWNGAIQNYWNEIAQTISEAERLSTAERARLFALLNFAVADGVIAFYDAKYTYNFWRPVTAIRAADSVAQAATVADPNWLPSVGNTPPDPSYPGAHAVVSAAALDVLISVLRRDRFALAVTSEVLPGVTRTFRSLSAAADEASSSRIFAGVHFRFDLESGSRLGHRVAALVVENVLTPRPSDDDHGRRDLSERHD